MEKQLWFCENCRKSGSVDVEKHADVFSVVLDIEDNHSEISPSCPQPVRLIRIVNDDFLATV